MPEQQTLDDIMTVKELAAYLKMTEKTLYRFALKGKIPAFRVGSAWRFQKSEIDKQETKST